MKLSGIQKQTLIDYPGQVACTIFTLWCNFRCPFCHNSDFVLPDKVKKKEKDLIKQKAFFNFLDQRQGLLDGVVVCGGEPTTQPDLIEFIQKIKDKWFLVKLDTNGSNYDVIKKLMDQNLLDYIALDVKYDLEEYGKLDGVDGKFVKSVEKTIELLKDSDLDYEFRTTVIKNYHDENVIEKIAQTLEWWKKYKLQKFQDGETLDPDFDGQRLTEKKLSKLQKIANKYIDTEIRN